MLPRSTAAFAGLLVALICGGEAVRAQTIDPHEVYERGCAGCHDAHAREFVAQRLQRVGDEIVGRQSGRELRAFLAGGHGRLAPTEIEALLGHLTAILDSGGLFRARCFVCHGRAVELARSRLALRGGRLVGRYTGRDIAGFMEAHGRLEPKDVPTILLMLERQLATQAAR